MKMKLEEEPTSHNHGKTESAYLDVQNSPVTGYIAIPLFFS